jgi:hypothetical protein
MRKRFSRVWIGFFLVAPLLADGPRVPATLDRNYQGAYPNEFTVQYDRVRLLVRQAQLEVSSQLGLLQYREGLNYPLTVRFEDQAPQGLEHALAYVRLRGDPQGFAQDLVINLSEAKNNPFDFDQIFYHEMTHAVMNDAVGGNAAIKIPHWVQEGLAQFISGEGPSRVEKLGGQVQRSQAFRIVADLDGPYTGLAYPSYYLAIRYLKDKHSINAVQTLVRNLIVGQSIMAALEDASGLTWERFRTNVRAYSTEKFEDFALPG